MNQQIPSELYIMDHDLINYTYKVSRDQSSREGTNCN